MHRTAPYARGIEMTQRTNPEPVYDFAIVGGGIVGLATALALTERYSGARLVLLDKENDVARHQTGHNSGVVHSGIYYKPGSLKARLCREGVGLLSQFCQAHDITYEACGKVIVATTEAEVERLGTLMERGIANGVPELLLLDASELAELEPNVKGLQAIYSPSTAIVDYGTVSREMLTVLQGRGADVLFGAKVTEVTSKSTHLTLRGHGFQARARYLVNCAGLYSDQIARLYGLAPHLQIVPFRGEYYMLTPEKRGLIRNLVYPVPDPALPFLGVHFTRTVTGAVEAGPNAVLAFAREGYTLGTIDLAETAQTLGFPGLWKLMARYWRVGVYEYYRSLSKTAFVRSLQRLVPSISASDLVRGHAGVRAQAVDRNGGLVDDFALEQTDRSLHVLNAPSPAATASMAIGKYLAEKVRLD